MAFHSFFASLSGAVCLFAYRVVPRATCEQCTVGCPRALLVRRTALVGQPCVARRCDWLASSTTRHRTALVAQPYCVSRRCDWLAFNSSTTYIVQPWLANLIVSRGDVIG